MQHSFTTKITKVVKFGWE